MDLSAALPSPSGWHFPALDEGAQLDGPAGSLLHGGYAVSQARVDACRNPAPVEWSLVPRSFLRGNYVLSRELIPSQSAFLWLRCCPAKPPVANRGGCPVRGDPLTCWGCR